MITIYDLWLDRVCGQAIRKKQQLIERYQSAEHIYQVRSQFALDGNLELDKGMEQYMNIGHIHAVTMMEADYPTLLKEIQNPPYCLYYKGNLSNLKLPTVAVVGTRNPSAYGRWAAEQLAGQLAAERISVVSGMAAGIDSCAHRGALAADGFTAAVLGCGVDVCYPAANRMLMRQILEYGVLLSEFLPKTEPKPFRFPLRNRIISGLSRGTVVVEAGLSSGSLITAELAAEQGRDVFAVPGNINQMNSIGCNKLIQDGAYPVALFADVAEQLGIGSKLVEPDAMADLGRDEQQLYQIVKREGEISFHKLAEESGKPTSKITGLVTILEMKGIFRTSFGKIFIAKS